MATMQDIADSVGLSRATISAVLNDRPGVSAQTRKKVLEAIDEHEFAPRLVKRTMLAEFVRLVGVVVRDGSNPFFSEAFLGMSETLARRGYHAVQQADFHMEEHADTFETFGTFGLAGYIMSPLGPGRALEFIQRAVKQGKHVVALAGPIVGVQTHVVAMDEYDGSYTATEYLIDKGHRHIAFLSGGLPWSSERIRGYVECLLNHGIDRNRVESAGQQMKDGYDGAMRLLADPKARPTAVVCFNDVLALGVYRAAHELRLVIPEDVSIIGFDGIALGRYACPPLTTVSYSPRSVGTRAAETLIHAVDGRYSDDYHYELVKGRLLEGGSVAPPRDNPDRTQ